jgi:nicotinamide riboside kinase
MTEGKVIYSNISEAYIDWMQSYQTGAEFKMDGIKARPWNKSNEEFQARTEKILAENPNRIPKVAYVRLAFQAFLINYMASHNISVE